jgi:alpha-glucosidase
MLQKLWSARSNHTHTTLGCIACAVLAGALAFLLALANLPDATAAQNPAPKGDDKRYEPKVTEIPEAIIKKYDLDTKFYKKHLDYKGFSILSSARVSDEALYEARYLMDCMLCEREDIVKALIKRGVRFMVMSPREMTTDVPEQSHWDKAYWDKRARGMGGKLSSCGEENLLNLKGDRYKQENILIHEFNHAIHQQGLKEVDPTFEGRLKAVYKKAMDTGLWKGTYSATNPAEYWAEGVQAYFDTMRPAYGANTREKLEKYDVDLYKLVDEVYKQSKYRYVRYDKRYPEKAAAAQVQDNINADMEKLEGKWKMVSLETKGNKSNEDTDQYTLAVKGNQWTTSNQGKDASVTFKIDPAKSPKHIDFTAVGPAGKEVPWMGIYKLEGDTLTVLRVPAAKGRPTEFNSATSGGFLAVWKRVK